MGTRRLMEKLPEVWGVHVLVALGGRSGIFSGL